MDYLFYIGMRLPTLITRVFILLCLKVGLDLVYNKVSLPSGITRHRNVASTPSACEQLQRD